MSYQAGSLYYKGIKMSKILLVDDDIELTESVVDGQMDFLELIDESTHVGRMILTNGDQMMYADWNGTELEDEEALPKYSQMLEEFKAVEKEYKEYMAEHPDCDCGCEDHHHNH